MLDYDRIDVSEWIDVDETIMNHVGILFVIIITFLKDILDLTHDRHDLMEKIISFNDVAIVSLIGNDYRNQFLYKSKDGAITIMETSDLKEKSGSLENF